MAGTLTRAAPVVLALLSLATATELACPSATASPSPPPVVPLVEGLVVTGAASERQGDYESTVTVDSVDPDGSLHLTAAGELPDPGGGARRPVRVTRDVRAVDLRDGRTYKYLFSNGDAEYPGTTAIGTSAAVIKDLRAHGKTSITLDGHPGGLAALVTGMLGMLQGAGSDGTEPNSAPAGYLSATGGLEAVEPKPVPFPTIVNNLTVSLPAWHLRGSFVQDEKPTSVEWYVLDDPANPLTLSFAFGKDRLDIVRIAYPAANETAALESALAETRRAVVYGIYFDFNSATIKPESEPVLHTIVEVMARNPTWVLNVEGHTDNVGGNARNQALSASRAAAVKQALVARGVQAARLNTSGFGASAPRATNTTLEGRARNRRVELTRS